MGAIWHLKNGEEEVFAREAFRVLKNKGEVVITTQASRSEKEHESGRFRKIISTLWNISPLKDKIQFNKFNENFISLLLQNNGFTTRVDECTALGFPWKIVIGKKDQNALSRKRQLTQTAG